MSVIRYNSAEEMNRMACFLIGKGKTVKVYEPGSIGNGNTQYALSVSPDLRWNTQRDYEETITNYMDKFRTAHGVGIHPRELSEGRIYQLKDGFLVCSCPERTIRPLQADRCFRCGYDHPNNYYATPSEEDLRSHLIKRHEEENTINACD